MASISDTPYEKHGGTDSGGDSLNFTPEQHHVSAVDSPKGGDPAGAHRAAQEVQEADSHESRQARRGAAMAVQNGSLKGDPAPFTPSDGCFRSGPDVGSIFDKAVNDSGGVRQGPSWCSDPAPGVHRSLVNHHITLADLSKQNIMAGSKDTFEHQRQERWVKN